jgi:hypothetical protein
MHWVGVGCGLAAGVWLGAAEAPTRLVNSGLSPYAISLCMVAGVFTALSIRHQPHIPEQT